jgi:PIN domain nuclease of toxin-antitoxin system
MVVAIADTHTTLWYLFSDPRLGRADSAFIDATVADPKAVLRYVPVDQDIATNMAAIPREDVPDLPDRIIAATAHLYGIPILTRDGRIRSSTVRAIW